MIFEVQDVDLNSLTLEELKEHAMICARTENSLRKYVIGVHIKIIEKIANQEPLIVHLVPTKSNPKRKSVKSILGSLDPLEDEFNIDDFRGK